MLLKKNKDAFRNLLKNDLFFQNLMFEFVNKKLCNEYIAQLIEDILSAQRTRNDYTQIEDDSFEAHIAEVERYLSGKGERKIADICGLYAEQFPPKHRMNGNQMNRVADAYLQMLNSWNVDIYLPEKLPVEVAYELLVGTLDRFVFVSNDEYSHIGIELCSYDEDNCPFGTEFCTCKNDRKEWEGDANEMENF